MASEGFEVLANREEVVPPAPATSRRRRVAVTLVCMLGAAAAVAACTPLSGGLTKPYAYVSAALGGMYFIAWSVSFWPQVFENRRRQTTVGLSADYSALNVLGFACYFFSVRGP